MSCTQSIEIVMGGEQHSLLGELGRDDMPLLERNLNTGWPLLPIGIYDFETSNSVVPAIGGLGGSGACHHMALGVYGFAQIAARLPGKKIVKYSYHDTVQTTEPIDLALTHCVHGYSLGIKQYAMTVAEQPGGYGKMSSLTIGGFEAEAAALYKALSRVHRVFMPDVRVEGRGGVREAPVTVEALEAGLREGAIFYNAQIWVDFGYFLSRFEISSDLINFFKVLFKPDEFLRDLSPKILEKRCANLLSSAECELMPLSLADALLPAALPQLQDVDSSAATFAVLAGKFDEAARGAISFESTATALMAACTVPLVLGHEQMIRRQSSAGLDDRDHRVPSDPYDPPGMEIKRRRFSST